MQVNIPQQLTSDQQQKYLLILEIYKKIELELGQLRKEVSKLKQQANTQNDKEKIKDLLHSIINTID